MEIDNAYIHTVIAGLLLGKPYTVSMSSRLGMKSYVGNNKKGPPTVKVALPLML